MRLCVPEKPSFKACTIEDRRYTTDSLVLSIEMQTKQQDAWFLYHMHYFGPSLPTSS